MIRDAILKAADSIEARPDLFDFESVYMPDAHCGTPGCALGWIAFHSGIEVPVRDRLVTLYGGSAVNIPFWPDSAIYRVLGVDDDPAFDALDQFDPDWRESAEGCAAALRKFADEYHPAEHSTKHHGIPESVRELFEVAA